MTYQTIDEIDLRIIELLLEDSLRSHKEIGEQIHLTGQTVGARIRKLQDLQVIDGFTIRWNPDKIGLNVLAFITVFMKLNQSHGSFRQFVQSNKEIEEVHRVGGEGCYWMRVRIDNISKLNELLEEVLRYGNYKLSLSIEKVK
ncbi:MAG TPA: Lrp/AsnC family transcriptional regulator [Paenibacillus sp.]|jgi:Lrp/AsnC family leucine-responsive transcriptional regulator